MNLLYSHFTQGPQEFWETAPVPPLPSCCRCFLTTPAIICPWETVHRVAPILHNAPENTSTPNYLQLAFKCAAPIKWFTAIRDDVQLLIGNIWGTFCTDVLTRCCLRIDCYWTTEPEICITPFWLVAWVGITEVTEKCFVFFFLPEWKDPNPQSYHWKLIS